jgi:DNA-binding FadR family transcriptional regulator
MQPEALEHVKAARMFLETGTARMAAEKASDEDVARLRLVIARQRASIADKEEFVNRDMAFHRELARISGNPIYPAIVESLFRWASDYYRPMVRAPGAEELTVAEHENIVDAIAKNDGEAAARAMEAHLGRASKLYGALSASK